VGHGANASTREPSERRAGPAAQRGRARRAERTGPARLILAGLLVAVVIAGIGAGPALGWSSSRPGPWPTHGEAIGIALEAVLAALLIALWVVHRTRPDPGWPATRLRAAQVPVIGALMVAVGVFLIHLSLPSPHTKPPRLTLPRRPKPTPSPVHLQQTQAGGTLSPIVEYVFLALLAIAVLAVLVVLLRMRHSQHDVVDEDLLPADDEGEMLRRAVEAGRAALNSIPESRRAIIACYLAMEGRLAQAGAIRGVAETPDELLARAFASGLLHGSAGARLTALFYRARFSAQPVPASARPEALAALDAILAELGQAAPSRTKAATRPAVTP
jgi:Domain of unknown function (DUF4129)